MFGIRNEKSIELKRGINKWRLNVEFYFNINQVKYQNYDTIIVYTKNDMPRFLDIRETGHIRFRCDFNISFNLFFLNLICFLMDLTLLKFLFF